MNSRLKIMLPLFVFALVLACSKDTPEPEVIIPPITGLDFVISSNDENPLQVAVTPSATGASGYKIYFDFVGEPTVFQETTGAVITHTYEEVTATYSIKVVASNTNGAADVQLSKDHTVTVIPDTVLADFESDSTPYLLNWGSATVSSVHGPIGDNSTKVGQIVNVDTTDPNWEGISLINSKYVDLTDASKRIISLDFYQETAATPMIGIKFGGTLTADLFDIEMKKRAVESAGWQTIEFDFGSDLAGNSYPNEASPVVYDEYESVTVFIGFGESQVGTFYIDNVIGALFSDTDIPDTDGDSIIDPLDSCSDVAGTTEFNGCPPAPDTILNLTAAASATSVRITGPWWNWDPNGGPEAVQNDAGTWDVTFPAPGLTENMEFLIVVDGTMETIWDNAANAECGSRIDGGTMITDYWSYGNRVWLAGSGNQSYVYDSCQ